MAKELILSTAELATTVQEYVGRAEELRDQGKRAEIIDQKTFDTGTDYRKIVTGMLKKLDAERKKIVGPYNTRIKAINAEFKKLTEILSEADDTVRTKMTKWYNEEEKRRKEEAEAIQRQAEEDALQAAEQAEKEGDHSKADAIVNLASDTEAPDVKIQGRGDFTGATSSAPKYWVGEVVDKKAFFTALANGDLPDEIVEIKQSKLNEIARIGASEGVAHGIKFTHETRLSVR